MLPPGSGSGPPLAFPPCGALATSVSLLCDGVEDHQGAPENVCTERYMPGDSKVEGMEERNWRGGGLVVSSLVVPQAALFPFRILAVLGNAKAVKPKRTWGWRSLCDWELKEEGTRLT